MFAAIYFFRRLPAQYMHFLLRLIWKVAFRLEVVGLENLPKTGERSVLAINHVSFLDAPLILSLARQSADLRDRPRDFAALVGQAVSPDGRRAAARSLPAARHARADPGGEAGQTAGDFPRRPHHRHRLIDESLRWRGDDRREVGGARHAGAARGAGTHPVLPPRRYTGGPALVSEGDRHDWRAATHRRSLPN